MPADRALGSLLRSLHTARGPPEQAQLTSTAASLLLSLSNPLNVTLLTSQVLAAPAFWSRPDGLRTCLRVLSIFHSASRARLKHGDGRHASRVGDAAGVTDRDEWVKAIVRGADEKSPRWRHLLVLGGVLLGFDVPEGDALPHGLRRDLEAALVKAANLALEVAPGRAGLEGHCVTFVLNHAFSLLSHRARSELAYDALLPVLVEAVFLSSEGFQSGYFLAAIDGDVKQHSGEKFAWSAQSPTFLRLQEMNARPLFAAMGPLSRLIAHTAECVKDPLLVRAALEQLSIFSRTMVVKWRRNKLSEIDFSEEGGYLDATALKTTLPALWQTLKTALFATVTVLRGAMARILQDRVLADDRHAPFLARQILHTLRSLYFISSRLGANAFSATVFVSLSAIDILSRYPAHAEAYVIEIRPSELGRIPKHPLDRSLDLNFLNTVEHMTPVLSPRVNEDLLVAAVTPYLTSGGNPNLREIFEAAHSVMLAVLSTPHNAELTARITPFYVESLFQTFPRNLSARQFRLAFKSVIRICSPPSPLSRTAPDLAPVLLELLLLRAQNAPNTPLPPPPPSAFPTPPSTRPARRGERAGARDEEEAGDEPTEATIIALTLLDSLPYLSLPLLEEYLPPVAQMTRSIADPVQRDIVTARFWDVVSAGEMDVQRAARCVAWWGTRGGREAVLGLPAQGDERGYGKGGVGVGVGVEMSGAL
ncbi:MAG: hypothetical protein M1838_002799 [Thelocarpon superellum]|nr:MAG: hypothetical protein M1838_002799 [Thelocarpon superellum]